MATGFTIDDVRDTLTSDVTRFLGRIESAARDLCERRDLGFDTVPDAIPLFQAIGDHGHAIHGTTCLVSAESLSASATAVERLALLGRDDLARAARHLERARKIAEILAAGASEMLAMLSLELDDRGAEARKIAAGWRARADETLAAAATRASAAEIAPAEPARPRFDSQVYHEDRWSEAAAEPPEDDFSMVSAVESVASERAERPAFSFAGSVAESSIDVDTGAIDVELALIFEEEARETLEALTRQLAELAATPGDRKLCRDLERSYHTLKGAAATVGLVAVSEKAAELQHRVESLYESSEPATPEFIARLVRDTDALRGVAGIESSPAAEPAEPPPAESLASALAGGDEVRAEFDREAQALLEHAEHLLGRLADDATPELVADLAKTLHRLQGSALVAGATSLGQCAERSEALCQGYAGPGDVAAIAAGVRRCAAMLDDWTRGSRASASSLDDMRGTFFAEARAICGEAESLLAGMRDSAVDPGPAREQLRKLLHRLKGSATVVWEEALAREAASFHEALERTVDTSALQARLSRIQGLVDTDRTQRRGARTRIAVPVPDAELEAGFQPECADLLDQLDRDAIALERSERPKDHLQTLLGTYHTLKGVVNSIGMRPTGDLIHRVEDFIEALRRAAIVPPLKGVVSALLQIHAEIRRNLKTVSAGYVEVAPRWDDRLHRIIAGESRATSGMPPSDVSQIQLGEGSEASGPTEGTDRKHIRVSIDRLDALMNLAGELVINRSRLLSRIDALQAQQGDLGRTSRRLTDIVERFRDEHEFSMVPSTARATAWRPAAWGAFSELELDRYEDVNILARTLAESSTDMHDLFGQLGSGLSSLADDSDALGGIITGIQSEITRARMVPLGSLFARLQLPIRDAAQREQRDVRIVTEGDDVHLDKTIVDALLQPMLHLVRNAVSHGLEAPARRAALGKPTTGTIRLRARQELGQIAVEVFDDGGGLDLAKLHARGVAMGLIPATVAIDDPKVRDLVFVPGISTSAAVGALAGRGVGCDVVRRAVERLNGSIRVETAPGRSTSFLISLPVTLAISRALLLRHGDQTFAVPLNFTERILDMQDHELVESAGRRRIELEDGFVNVRPISEFLGGTAVTRDGGPVVILRVGDQRLVIQVDGVAGQEEIVVKGLGALLTGHPLFAGVTIRGTGEIVLILDVPSLVDSAVTARETREPEAVEAPPIANEHPAVADHGKLRVLFVDDSVSVRKVAERALQALGVDVTLAVDGVDALDKLHARPFDLVFTDLEMPRMHGYELIRELRFLPAFRALPVVVVTSRSGKKHREEAEALGATHYMTKPFSPQSLEAALSKFGGPRAAGLGTMSSDGPASEVSP
jgi:chemosensory pili system protein ChpA (sensor histidine kinase/response regulator)